MVSEMVRCDGEFTEDYDAEGEGKTRTFVISSVDYDTGQRDDLDLPQDFTLTLDIDEIGDTTDMQEIADYLVEDISDETGWLVEGFYFQEKMPDGTLVSLDAEEEGCPKCGDVEDYFINECCDTPNCFYCGDECYVADYGKPINEDHAVNCTEHECCMEFMRRERMYGAENLVCEMNDCDSNEICEQCEDEGHFYCWECCARDS